MAVSSDSLDFTFLDAVNRVLRENRLITGDDDAVTTFTDTQHAGNISDARIAIQNELSALIADKMIDLEFVSASITTSNGVRTYALPTDFIRFAWDAFFYKASSNRIITEYPGGQERLRKEIYDYRSQDGEPSWWYWEPSTQKKIGFFQVPDGAYTYTYDYQRSVYVTLATDEMPFHNQEEADMFCKMAAIRFKYIGAGLANVGVQMEMDQSPSYKSAKATLYNLLRPMQPRKSYGRVYV